MLRIKHSTLIVRNYHLFIIFMLVFNALIFSPRLENGISDTFAFASAGQYSDGPPI